MIKPLLSICIPTFNRPKILAYTLRSILEYKKSNIEIIVVDGSDNEETKLLIKNCFKQKNIFYFKQIDIFSQPSNHGFDRACNQAVEMSKSEYCWLLTDDDLIVKGSIENILDNIKYKYDLIVTSSIIKDNKMSKTYVKARPNIRKNIVFKPNQMHKFIKTVTDQLTFVGSIIIKKEVWMKVEREKYFGTGFVHVGVIFDQILTNNILVMKDPVTIIRFGVGHWQERAFKIWMIDWPELIWSFKFLAFKSKRILSKKEPWKNIKALLFMRSINNYNYNIFNKYISKKPINLFLKILSLLISIFPRFILFLPSCIYIITYMPQNKYLLSTLIESYRIKK